MPVPFTVIGGYLGAGKTTLVNRLLADADGERIAVVVNDVGDVPIDTELIAAHDGSTITLTNGCICCSLADEFAFALPDLLTLDPPLDRIVVEASGLSDPGAVAQYGTLPGFRLDGVLVLADAETVRERAADPRIGHQVVHQLRRADLVVVTKTDLVGAADLTTVRSWLVEASWGAPVIIANHGHVPRAVLFGTSARAENDVDRHTPADRPDDHGVDVIEVIFDAAMERIALNEWIAALPVDVLRAKGLVRIRDDSGAREAVVQVVGRRRRVTLRPTTTPPLATAAGRLVIVAPHGGFDHWEPPDGTVRTATHG